MFISLFELFRIGIGPSSSHTVGPMRAAFDFISSLENQLNEIESLQITLYGSLAFTYRGHGTDKALLMGFEGNRPEIIDPDHIVTRLKQIRENKQLKLLDKRIINFDEKIHLICNKEKLFEYHSNAMQFIVFNKNQEIIKEEVYFSVGGGFIVSQTQIDRNDFSSHEVSVPYPFDFADELLNYYKTQGLSIRDVMMANEKALRNETEIKNGILNIAGAMLGCIDRGCLQEGILEGGLNVRRRAPDLYKKLLQNKAPKLYLAESMRWINVYALAVNEENAAGGRVVTAPTNGAAGIIPAVLKYYLEFCENANDEGVIDLLITAAAIGILYKKNASISGAEMGCQGEVGVACSMAAGGLTAALGGTIYQIENAAEIGMEHNLGLTCDPVAGLVQIPCIERNAMGAVKAVNAAYLALAEEGQHKVSLDMVIKTMREIGMNMNTIYKETSKGGLAVNVPEC